MDQWLPAGKTKGFSIDIKNLAEGRVYKFLVRAVSTGTNCIKIGLPG